MNRATINMGNKEQRRCPWHGIVDPVYARYHDEEWGVPLADDRALFEKLVLEGFQAGLSWLTILRKRDNFRAAFQGFDPERIARFGAREQARLMKDEGIVRNRLKIEATVANARAYIALQERDSLAALMWRLARENTEPRRAAPRTMADIPGKTRASALISKTLKKAGFRFVGPTTIYALMQSAGMVNDHLATCHRRAACAALQREFSPPQ
ncbi:MAG: DNA-3-methyladenine glycosylase I [Hyphomicrobiaceae bacterium]|nr:DNA-3-methyladenine glycosylase I [Hyphomicrobiaceae bacterium]